MNLCLKLFKTNKGQAMAEMALVLPLLLLLLFGCIEFGRVYGASLLIDNLARDGVRCGVVGYTDVEIEDSILNNLIWLDPDNISVSINPLLEDRVTGEPLEVQIDYNVDLVAPVISDFLPNPVPVSSRYIMRIE